MQRDNIDRLKASSLRAVSPSPRLWEFSVDTAAVFSSSGRRNTEHPGLSVRGAALPPAAAVRAPLSACVAAVSVQGRCVEPAAVGVRREGSRSAC